MIDDNVSIDVPGISNYGVLLRMRLVYKMYAIGGIVQTPSYYVWLVVLL